jgi:hypothetical protein
MIGYEFKELWYERVNRFHLVQDKLQWWALVKTVMNRVFRLKVPNVLT